MDEDGIVLVLLSLFSHQLHGLEHVVPDQDAHWVIGGIVHILFVYEHLPH